MFLRARPIAPAIPVILALLASPLCARAEAPVVENPATPAQGRVTLEPEQLWRVGGHDESYLFGVVGASAIDADGNTYLLDQQLSEITVIDRQGHHLTTFGREGEGPGELRQAQAIMLLPGDRIGVLNGRPPKLNTYTLQGDPLGDLSLASNEGFHFALAAQPAGTEVIVQTTATSFDDDNRTQSSINALRAVDPLSGEYVRDILVETEERDMLGDGGRRVVIIGGEFVADWAVAEDGTIYVVRDRTKYEIEVYDREGNLARTIRRAGDRIARPEANVRADIAQRKAMAEQFGQTFDADEVDTFENHVVQLIVRPGGAIWVLTGTGLAHDDPQVIGVFDEFDAEGKFTRQIELRAPFDRAQDRMSLTGDALVVYENLVAARGSGIVINGVDVAREEADDEEVEPLAIVRYDLR